MKILTRNQVSIIFKARTRMLKIKNNFKKGNQNLKCRACNTAEETQKHVLEECKGLHTCENTKVTNEEIFDENPTTLGRTAEKIENIINKLETA